MQQKIPSPETIAANTTKASRYFCSEVVLTVFQDFVGHAPEKFAELQGDAQKEGTILSVSRLDVWIVTVT